MRSRISLIFFLATILFTSLLRADSSVFLFDDDALASRDDFHYTGGLFYGYMFDENRSFINPKFLKSLHNTNALSFTYMAFTPEDKESHERVLNDIPYAGYMKIEFSDYKYDNNMFLNLAINISAVGPDVKAKQIQSNFHKLIGHSTPNGWDNQLKDHLFAGLKVGYGKKSAKMNFKKLQIDWCNYIEGELGNFYSGVSFSSVLRFANNLPDTFALIPNLSNGTTDELLNFKPMKNFDWSVEVGLFANKVSNFYIIDRAIDIGYKLSHIDYIYGLGASLNIFYNHIKYTFKIKTSTIHNKSSSTFDDEQWGSLSATWKF